MSAPIEFSRRFQEAILAELADFGYNDVNGVPYTEEGRNIMRPPMCLSTLKL